ncbi:rCG53308 [Rattus norvegicus]|uniref:RCG53308 n=1 Tax=Rattus norvegicus TaxID=10116 RepID=A6JMV6_RAT|nr:rCG53308 [Rattus norvegicus]
MGYPLFPLDIMKMSCLHTELLHCLNSFPKQKD